MQGRKTVTILFCDVVDSTPLGEALDPESLQRVMSRWFAEAREVIELHGGTVEKFIGDEVMAVFGVPHVHEDDALRGVRAASDLLDRLAVLNEELARTFDVQLAVRIGVNTGEVVVGDPAEGGTFVTGAPVNLAKRLEQAAGAGQILIGRATYPLVRDAVKAGPLETFKVKGRQEPVSTRRVDHVDAFAPGVARRTETRLVGRRNELDALRAAHDAVVGDRSCRLVTLLGAAGVGKSRLADELAAAVAPGTLVLASRCLPYGDGITFWPLSEIMRQIGQEGLAAALDGAEEGELVAERLQAVSTVDEPAAVDELFWAVRRLLEELASLQPVLVLLDDIHWAEPTLLDLIEYLHGWIADAPVLLMCSARPELLDRRPSWSAPRSRAETSYLEPLDESESELLLTGLGADLSEADRDRVLASAEGNPLYVEQLAALAASGDVVVPPTIAALLAERLDRLEPSERAIAERAAVVGREFSRREVTDLCPPELRPDVRSVLLTLVRKELIEPRAAAREDGFRFRHGLIRDAAYDGMPKESRALFHEWYADWLERNAGEAALRDELAGYHLEQSYRLRLELSPPDERTSRIGRRAAERLGAAGRRAFAREDLPAAINLLDRALAHAPPTLAERPALLLDLSAALWSTGELTRSDELLDEVTATVEPGSALYWHAEVERVVREQARGAATLDEIAGVAGQARSAFAELGDALGRARAGRRLVWVHIARCEFAQAEQVAEEALAAARVASDAREEARIADGLCTALLWGPTHVDEALDRCDAMLSVERADRSLAAHVRVARCGLLAMRGEFDTARREAARARSLYEDLRLRFAVAGLNQVAGEAELLAGDAAAAESLLRESAEILAPYRGSAVTAAVLAHALLAQDRVDEAEAEATGAAGADPLEVGALVRAATALAHISLRRGRHEDAAAQAQHASDLAEKTDALNLRAEAAFARAQASAAIGDQAGAEGALAEARELFTSKGNTAALGRIGEPAGRVSLGPSA